MRERGVTPWIVAACAPLWIGCSRKAAIVAPAFDPNAAVAAALAAFDTDGSGDLSAAEWEASPGIKAAARRIDADGDGSLTQSEMARRFASYRVPDGTVVPVHYRITMDRRILRNATVTLTPEPFMGAAFTVCSGTSGENGEAVVSAPDVRDKGFAGVYPGLYRVSVMTNGSADGVPAAHADSGGADAGQEVSLDLPELERILPLPLTRRPLRSPTK